MPILGYLWGVGMYRLLCAKYTGGPSLKVFDHVPSVGLLRHVENKNDLLIRVPLVAVPKDKNDFNGSIFRIPNLILVKLSFAQFPVGGIFCIAPDDIIWCHNILEAAAFRYLPSLVRFATNHKNCVTTITEFSHDCVATHELSFKNNDLYLVSKMRAPILLRFSTSFRDKDI